MKQFFEDSFWWSEVQIALEIERSLRRNLGLSPIEPNRKRALHEVLQAIRTLLERPAYRRMEI